MSRRNYNTFLKKQKAEKKRKAKLEKKLKKESRKDQASSGNLEDMMAYVDDDGNIVSVDPPEQEETKESADNEDNPQEAKDT
ncbi:MAG: hypothetical protein DHS20C17_17960 [Cyclobacteriaceae bacterium]|nr:MAG: hypothetical protein DHS20C17_17960 [Cyclobacteriaceae bacterium]